MTNALFRAVRQSFQQLGRGAWIWFATFAVFFLAFFSINALLGTGVLAQRLYAEARSRVDIAVAFKPGTPPAVVEQAKTFLFQLPSVEGVDTVSADQALEGFRGRYRTQEPVLRALDEIGRNPLGARLTVRTRDLAAYPAVARALASSEYEPWIQRQSAGGHSEAIRELEAVGRAGRLVGSLLLALFACVGLLLAFNAVRLAVFAQREEIQVMRLVGATQGRIRLPYVLSVLWVVALAWAALGAAACLGFRWLYPQTGGWFRDGLAALEAAVLAGGWRVFFVELLVAAGLSGAVAYIATGKYIKR